MEKISILIIEDNADIRESTSEILELADYEVFQASNGKQGVDLAIKHTPDVILCDIMMPELDGYGVLYLLFCWTFIPAGIALIDFIIFLSMDEDKFNLKYILSSIVYFVKAIISLGLNKSLFVSIIFGI